MRETCQHGEESWTRAESGYGVDTFGSYCTSGGRSSSGGTSSVKRTSRSGRAPDQGTEADIRSLRSYYLSQPDAALNRCPTRVFVVAVQMAFKGSGEIEDGNTQLEDIICTLSTLIDHVSTAGSRGRMGCADHGQGLVLAFLSYSQQNLALKPAPDGFGGFPRVCDVAPRRTIANQ